jgi:hypothetical protein
MASTMTSLEPGKERRLVGLDLDTGCRSRPKEPCGLLHNPLCRDQVDEGIGCLIKILLGPVMVS